MFPFVEIEIYLKSSVDLFSLKKLDFKESKTFTVYSDKESGSQEVGREVDMKSEEFEQIGSVIYLEKKKAFEGNSRPLFWAIASGKGGVGRSFFTTSLGITLSRIGYRVLMVDADPKGGNLHTLMGTSHRHLNLSDYFKNTDSIKNYFITLGHEKLRLMAGDSCMWTSYGENKRSITDLLADLRSQPFDVVLFDLAAGIDEDNSELIKQADETFLLTTPEATSIEKTYRWVENYILKINLTSEECYALQDFYTHRRKSQEGVAEQLFSVRDYLFNIRKQNQNGVRPFGPIKLVVNQTRNFEDERLADPIKSICNKFYFTDVQVAGYVQYDNAVWQCARQRVPVLIHQPFNPLVGQIQGLVKQLVDQHSQRAVV